ncbi:hypothetical protein BAE44_0002673 [Dichanthelium oligosanthes]|uniref:DUF1618 domain-containing protein n=1 Tax=Dichanthelium oligosanthes TaxID=888268 RepID=A0A1E5WFX8_9POAL|nr:hypothetical protein BAE44_0002673 [Dichanthelium oligosanthes]
MDKTIAAARSLDPTRDVSAPVPVPAGWALFDRRVALGRDPASSGGAAAAASAKTSNVGRDVRVSLRRVATPPTRSCVQLCTDDDVLREPSIVAADGDLLLIHMAGRHRQRQRPQANLQGEGTGIARSGEGFVVAHLKVRKYVVDRATMLEGEVAMVWLYRCATNRWETKEGLAMPHDPDEGFSEPHVKFVDVDNGRFRSTGDTNSDDYDVCHSSDDEGFVEGDDYCFTITTWTLRMPELEWEQDAVFELQELWSLPSYRDSPLPRTVLTFRVVDLQDDDVLYFVVKGPGFYDRAWMVTVDMEKSLGPYALYENPIVEGNCSLDLTDVFPYSPMISITNSAFHVPQHS